jgi:DNA primase
MIPPSFIQELLSRVDIVEVIDPQVPLKRSGANYSARCPFHSEKTPSFTVSPAKQFYHCFGCGAHGTALGFLIEYHGMGFIEAVKDLAARAGMSVPEHAARTPEAQGESSDDLHGMLAKAAQFYKSQLKGSERAIGYLKRRGLTGEVAARYGLGYSPDGWQSLAAAVTDYRTNPLLAAAGLVLESTEGRRYDRFRDRIMFPIVNAQGYIVGFGGRVIDAGEPKYLNSPETAVFEKGRELYGLFQARRAIREAGMALVVEGYMDVVALAQHGIGYCVATLGTATTPTQVQKLLRQTDKIVFCFDGDEAGRKAAWRALENSLAAVADGKQLAFLFLPDGEDPDSYVRGQGTHSFEQLLGKALPLSEFMFQELVRGTDLRTAEGRAKLLQDAKPLVKQVAAPMFSLVLRKRLAELAGVTQSELDQRYEIKALSPVKGFERRAAPKPSILRKLCEMLAFRPELVQRVEVDGLREASSNPAGDLPPLELQLLNSLIDLGRESPHMKGIAEYFRDTPLYSLAQEVETAGLGWEERRLDDEALVMDFTGAWGQLMDRVRRARIAALLAKGDRSGWTAEDKDLLRSLQQRSAPASFLPDAG